MLRLVLCAALLAIGVAGKAMGATAADIVGQLRSELSRHHERDSAYINILNDLSYALYRSEVKDSKKFADEALALSTKLGYEKGIAYANRNLHLYYLIQGNYPLSMEFSYSALNSFEDHHDNLGIAMCLIDLSVIYRVQQDWEKATANLATGLEIAEKNHYEDEITRALKNYGSLNGDQRKFKESIEYFNKALARIDTAKDNNPISQVPDILTGIGVSHVALFNMRTGFRYEYAAIAASRKHNDLYCEANTCVNIGRFSLGGDTLDTETASKYLKRGEILANQLNAKRALMMAYFGNLEWKMTVGDNAAAHIYQVKYSALKDSMINVAKAIKTAELEGRYENQRKERELRELHNAERTSNVEKILLVVALTIGVSIAGVAIWQQRKTKEKIRKLLDQSSQPTTKVIILPTPRNTASLDDKFLADVIDVIEKNIQDPAFGVVEMSEQMGMSRAQLQRKLKSLSAPTPAELIKDYRLNRAAELIRQKADTITQIGYAVGFNDQSYFAKCFKKKFGLSPSAYLERIQG